jgi:hypothetical protein
MDAAFIDAAADAIGRAVAAMQRDALQAEQVRTAEHRAKIAELDAFILRTEAEIDRRVSEKLAAVRDGAPGAKGEAGAQGEKGEQGQAGAQGEKGEQGLPGTDGQLGPKGDSGAPGEKGLDGKDGSPGLHGRDGRDGVAGPPGRDGANGVDGKDGAPGERGEAGLAGRDGDVGPPGKDAPRMVLRGVYDPAESYDELNIVTLDGSTWMAKGDSPDHAPGAGSGWMLLAGRGRRGEKGERGEQGRVGVAGRDAPVIVGWRKEGYSAVAVMSDGTEAAPLDVREFFEAYHSEAVR